MAERERLSLGDGIAVFRQYRTWIIEIYRHGKRIRGSLETRDKGKAVMMAGAIARALRRAEMEIETACVLAAVPAALHEKMAQDWAARGISILPPGSLDNPQSQAAFRLRDAALESLHFQDSIKCAVREGIAPTAPVLPEMKRILSDVARQRDVRKSPIERSRGWRHGPM